MIGRVLLFNANLEEGHIDAIHLRMIDTNFEISLWVPVQIVTYLHRSSQNLIKINLILYYVSKAKQFFDRKFNLKVDWSRGTRKFTPPCLTL
jgi:hypothetical protein